jgi:hypothetical protein
MNSSGESEVLNLSDFRERVIPSQIDLREGRSPCGMFQKLLATAIQGQIGAALIIGDVGARKHHGRSCELRRLIRGEIPDEEVDVAS